jgi:hypothetical protein
MANIPEYPFESETLNENWELLKPFYDSLKEVLDDHDFEEDDDYGMSLYELLLDRVFHEWEQIYPKYVLEPAREGILKIFKEALLREFTTQPKVKEYLVIYYTAQYFFVGIQPFHDEEKHFRLDLKMPESKEDLNIELYDLIEELWEELDLTELSEEEIYEDKSDFYDREVAFLLDFLSEIWNEAKASTKINATAILSEGTSIGRDYSLDDKSVVEE